MQNSIQGFRLSNQQENIWTLQKTFGPAPFICRVEVAITGRLEAHLLRQALQTVVARHEILRTTFHRPAGLKTIFQVIGDAAEVKFQTADLSALSGGEQREALDTTFAAVSTFNYSQGPLLDVALFKLSENQHLLFLTAPALCVDPFTTRNLVAELISAYQTQLSGAGLSSEPMQYADFAEWQNELVAGDDEAAHEGRDYWSRQETTALSPLSFPLEKRKSAASKFTPRSVSIEFSPDSLDGLRFLARENQVTISSVLLGAWQALCWRLTGQADFPLFVLSDGRALDDLSEAVGPYAKYLPIAGHGDDVPFAEYLRWSNHEINKAAEWQEYFDASKFNEGAADAVGFECFEQPAELAVENLKFAITREYGCLSPLKLRMSASDLGTSLRAELHYNAELFAPQQIQELAGYFQNLVLRLSAAPGDSATNPVGAIELLTESERQRLVSDFNRTAVAYSEDRCVHELFELQAARTPDLKAVVCGDQKLTYAELNQRANQLAHWLRAHGITASTRVGFCMERSAESIVALLGILKAGGAYVALNPEHPPARLELQLKESNTQALITKGGLKQKLDFGGAVIDFERDQAQLASEPEGNLSVLATAEDLVYVIYTSGSTGVPKGVALRHRNLVNYIEFSLRRLQVTEPLHFATVSTLTADLGNTCIFPCLLSGGCLHLVSYETAMEGEQFAAYLAKHPIDVLKIVPSHINALLASNLRAQVLPSRYLILGGEALSWDLIESIKQANAGCQVINHYGPTETTVGSLTFTVDPHATSDYSATVPIGRPIANTQVYILDSYLHPTPTGVPAELYIGGSGVAAGYLNQPQETAARFLSDPFSSEPGARIYRTGDLARHLPDGNVEFLGRIDQQVKVRGFRVELGEIEAVLSQHPSVRQAVVTAATTAGDGGAPNQRLFAYIVSAATRPPTVDELREFLLRHLPDYMIPSAFMFLKALPLTPNGKLDRAALPAPDESRPDLQRIFVAPRNSVETQLAAIWAEFLKLNEVGIHDNFFELGGHSLLATQVVSRMRKAFNCEISLRSLFETPTVAEIAAQIAAPPISEAERLLSEIEQLSDAEAELLLKSEGL